MARGRMIDNCISTSETVNDLTVREAFIYTWIIPHLDDWGRISGSPRTLKAKIFPMKKEITIKYIEQALAKFKEWGLFLWEEVDGVIVLQQPFEKFNEHQHISDKKRSGSKYPEVLSVSPESPRIPGGSPDSPVQVNLSKEKIIKDKYGKFVELSKEEYKKLLDKFGKAKTDSLIEDLNFGIGSKGYKYKDFYLTILAWDKRNNKGKETTTERIAGVQAYKEVESEEVTHGKMPDDFKNSDLRKKIKRMTG